MAFVWSADHVRGHGEYPRAGQHPEGGDPAQGRSHQPASQPEQGQAQGGCGLIDCNIFIIYLYRPEEGLTGGEGRLIDFMSVKEGINVLID